MAFLTTEFYLFCAAAFALYWALPKRAWVQNSILLATSVYFYSRCSWSLLGLFAGVVATAYGAAFLPRKKWAVALPVVAFVLLLGVFKYYDFFVVSVSDALTALGFTVHLSTLKLMLPLGISFYSFMAIAYVVDVYKGKIEPERNPLKFATFMMFFPQIAAGPIGRADKMLPQFAASRGFSDELASDGLRQFLWGAFKKVVIADQIALFVDPVFNGTMTVPSTTRFLVACFYAVQIYADFSAYSDMAVGVGKLFGLRLMRNFANPYFAFNIGDFWRRWHISLTTWFRDYVYIPLGGNRCAKWRTALNSMIVFLVSGLWHGANWTYVVWGGLHGLFMVPLAYKKIKGNLFTWFVTMGLVVFAWIFFRAPTIGGACSFIADFFPLSREPIPDMAWTLSKYVGLMFAVEWVNRDEEHGLARVAPWRPARWLVYLAILWLACYFYRETSNFIYFQF